MPNRVMCGSVESLCPTPETNKALYVSWDLNKLLEENKNRKTLKIRKLKEERWFS